MRKGAIGLLMFGLFVGVLVSSSQAKMKKLGQAGMTFLSIDGSARAAAMAGNLGYARGDMASAFHNPAGMAFLEGRGFYFNWTRWLADMSVAHMAVAWNVRNWGTFSLAAQVMDYGDIPGTVIDMADPKGYQDTGNLNDVGALSVGVGYAIQMTDKFAIGGIAKVVDQKLGHNDTYIADQLQERGKLNHARGLAFDFGTRYDTGIRSLVVAMSLRNYSGQLLYENEEFQLPLTYRIELSANLFQLLPWSPGEGQQLVMSLAGVDPRERPQYLNVGLEYGLGELLAVRAGWNGQAAEDNIGGLTAGVGLKLHSLGARGRFDLAWASFGSALGSVLRVSLQGSF